MEQDFRICVCTKIVFKSHGYTNLFNLTEEFLYFDVGGSVGLSSTSYGNVKIGADYLLNEKLKLSMVVNNHILLHKEKQGLFQNRYYLTLDVGMRYAISENWAFNLSSPVPITSMVSGKVGVLGKNGAVIYDLKLETIGLLFGFTFKF